MDFLNKGRSQGRKCRWIQVTGDHNIAHIHLVPNQPEMVCIYDEPGKVTVQMCIGDADKFWGSAYPDDIQRQIRANMMYKYHHKRCTEKWLQDLYEYKSEWQRDGGCN